MMDDPATTRHGLMLCDDLIFFSRVAGTARALGLAVRQAKTTTELLELAKRASPPGIILDLQNDSLDLVAFLRELGKVSQQKPYIVAYGSHVETETLRAARKAGCDRVLPRSQFVEELERGLPVWLDEGDH